MEDLPPKKETYFEFKLRVLSSFDGYITDIVLTSANVDDCQAIWKLVSLYNNITIIGGKGYISKKLQKQLSKEKNIALITRKRRNSKYQFSREFIQLAFKVRKRIETSFSQLTKQLNLSSVKAKSPWRLIIRLRTMILSHNIYYFISKYLGKSVDTGKIKKPTFG
ncbi:MAG: Transposase, IS4 [Sporanaerobacter sp.]|jgi:hypothetical protein